MALDALLMLTRAMAFKRTKTDPSLNLMVRETVFEDSELEALVREFNEKRPGATARG